MGNVNKKLNESVEIPYEIASQSFHPQFSKFLLGKERWLLGNIKVLL